ncbi:hypothetical protein RND81_01G046700 [Saponaria officinalis]|uniref:RRM domain-containing protein n=1 Tax=Saponaria officinalis TaxID=3572 RepID=A0AAW1N5Q9_SAPOF
MSYSRRSNDSRSPSPCRRYGRSISRSMSRSRSRSRESSAENPGNNLYVTGLSTRVTKRELEKHFSSEGKVEGVHLVTDPWTGESRGFGFVTMSCLEEAERCVKYLNRSVLEGRVITVEKSRRSRGRIPTPGKYLGLKAARGRGRSTTYSPHSRRSSRYSSDRERSYSLYSRRDRSYSPYYTRRSYRSRSRSYTPYYSSIRRSRYDYSPDDRYYRRSSRYDYSPDGYYRRSRRRSYSRSCSRSPSRSYSPRLRRRSRRSPSRSYSPRPRRSSRRSYSRSYSPRSRRSCSRSLSRSPKRRSCSRSLSRSPKRSVLYSPKKRERSYDSCSSRSYSSRSAPSRSRSLLKSVSPRSASPE